MAIGTLFGTNSESVGLYGSPIGGVVPSTTYQTYFEWFIFKESVGQPSTPTGGSWDFSSNVGTAPTGWSTTSPSIPVNPVWFCTTFVDSRNPTTIIWSTPAKITAGSAAAAVDISFAPTGIISSTNVQSAIVEVVNDLSGDFGAIGDGITDDTAAWVTALATGKSITGKSGANYKITGQLTIGAANQFINGNCTFTPVGNFDVFKFTGGDVCGFNGPKIDAVGMSGGYVFNVFNADRVSIENTNIFNPYSVLYAQRTNTLTINKLWAVNARGGYGIHLYGTPSNRSDVINLYNVTISASNAVTYSSRMTGLKIDGNVQSLTLQGVRIITPSRGVWITNSTGGTYPTTVCAFIEADDVEVDYPYYEGLRDEIGQSHNWTNVYFANSITSCGVYVGSTCSTGSIKGGVIRGNAIEGVQHGGTDYAYSDLNISINSFATGNLGKYAGVSVLGTAIRTSFTGVHSGQDTGSGAVQKYGIEVLAGAINTSWVGGSLLGNLQAPWSDSSGIGLNNFTVLGAAGCNLSVCNNILTGTDAGFGCRATPNLSGGAIATVTVTAGGLHYEAAPSVYAFDPLGTGSGATFNTTIVEGVITAIGVTAGGSNYSAGTIIYLIPVATAITSRPYYPGITDVNMRVRANGPNGQVALGTERGDAFQVTAEVGAVNYLVARGTATGVSPTLFSAGADTDLDVVITPKGNGYIKALGAIGMTGKTYLGLPSGGLQINSGMYAGSGAPNNANGANGDFYFRSDGGALTSIYQRRAGAWIGIV